jgi:hypothetical protein
MVRLLIEHAPGGRGGGPAPDKPRRPPGGTDELAAARTAAWVRGRGPRRSTTEKVQHGDCDE